MESKPVTVYTNDSKTSTSFTNDAELAASYMLKEDFFHLLLETGERIILAYGTTYTNDLKPSTLYS